MKYAKVTLFLNIWHGDIGDGASRAPAAVQNANQPNNQANNAGLVEWDLWTINDNQYNIQSSRR